MLPAGIYLPFEWAHKTISGNIDVAYSALSPLNVGYFLLPGSTKCSGGIGVNIAAPYDDHRMFASQCQNEHSLIVNLERKVKFRIVNKKDISKSLLQKEST